MIRYLGRIAAARAFSMTLTVLGLSLALAAVSACLQLRATMRSGHPRGTHFTGTPMSLFAYISSMHANFFLDPFQIRQLQADLGTAGELIAASGGRYAAAEIGTGSAPIQVGVDIVSSNFFSALGVRSLRGDTPNFSMIEPVCIVSEEFLQRLHTQKAPERLGIAGKSYRVIGVTAQFRGIFDHETEVWVPWQHGSNILSPKFRDKGLDQQPGLYWALAIPKQGSDPHFRAAVERLLQRSDLLAPPWDEFRAIPGITNSEPKRRDADNSLHIYLAVSLLMLLVAAVGLSLWSALTRTDQLGDEILFMQLGISRQRYLAHNAALVGVPLVVAALLAVPLFSAYQAWLGSLPAIAGLLADGADLVPPSIRANAALLLLLTASSSFALNGWVAHRAGVHYGTFALRFDTHQVRKTFRGLIFAASAACALGVAFAYFAGRYSEQVLRNLSIPDAQRTWFLFPRAADVQGLTSRTLQMLISTIQAELPAVQNLGFVQAPPLISWYQRSSFSLEEYGDPVISVFQNAATASAPTALQARLIEGRLYADDAVYEMLVDQTTQALLLGRSARASVVGLTLYDSASTPYRIVGVVGNIPFVAEPGTRLPVVYTPIDPLSVLTPSTLVLDGAMTQTDLIRLIHTLEVDTGVRFDNEKNLARMTHTAFAQYRSRVLLSLLSAIATALLAGVIIVSISSLEVRHQRRNLAIFSALGATPLQVWWRGCGPLAWVLLAGACVGVTSLYVLQAHTSLRMQVLSAGSWLAPSASAIALVSCVGIAFLSLAFSRQFARRPMAAHLREE